MKVLALCDNLYDVTRFESTFKLDHIYYLICNNRKSKITSFVISQILSIPNFRLSKLSNIINLYIKGYLIFLNEDINSKNTVNWVVRNNFHIGLHSMGVIYKNSIINSFKLGILNAHIGKLPEMRGRSVFEWSLINDIATGITCFFIDAGIDTGERIVLFYPFQVNSDLNNSKSQLFKLDAFIYKKSVDLIKNGMQFQVNDITHGKRYYLISNFLKSTLIESF